MSFLNKFVTSVAAWVAVLIAAMPAHAEQISVTHWGVLMYGAPYAVAMEKGFFKEAGVNIDGILTSKGGGTTMRNVLASGLPYGEVALSAAVAAANQGIDVRIVNAGVRTAGVSCACSVCCCSPCRCCGGLRRPANRPLIDFAAGRPGHRV